MASSWRSSLASRYCRPVPVWCPSPCIRPKKRPLPIWRASACRWRWPPRMAPASRRPCCSPTVASPAPSFCRSPLTGTPARRSTSTCCRSSTLRPPCGSGSRPIRPRSWKPCWGASCPSASSTSWWSWASSTASRCASTTSGSWRLLPPCWETGRSCPTAPRGIAPPR